MLLGYLTCFLRQAECTRARLSHFTSTAPSAEPRPVPAPPPRRGRQCCESLSARVVLRGHWREPGKDTLLITRPRVNSATPPGPVQASVEGTMSTVVGLSVLCAHCSFSISGIGQLTVGLGGCVSWFLGRLPPVLSRAVTGDASLRLQNRVSAEQAGLPVSRNW